MRCPHCNKNIPYEDLFVDIFKEIVFREVHNHEVDTQCSIHPCELSGLREILKKEGKIVMEE